MFSVLYPLPAKGRGGIFKRERPPFAEAVRTVNGLPFYLIKFPFNGKDSAPESAIKAALCRAPRVLAPFEFNIPEKYSRAFRFPCTGAAELCFSCVVSLFEKAGKRPLFDRLTVIDPDGLLAGRVCALLPFAAAVGICTGKKERFAADAAQAMQQYGAALVFPDSAPENGAKIYVPHTFSETGLYAAFSVCGRAFYHRPALPPAYRACLPPGIDPLWFAALLYETCRERPCESELFTGFLSCGREYDFAQTAALLR